MHLGRRGDGGAEVPGIGIGADVVAFQRSVAVVGEHLDAGGDRGAVMTGGRLRDDGAGAVGTGVVVVALHQGALGDGDRVVAQADGGGIGVDVAVAVQERIAHRRGGRVADGQGIPVLAGDGRGVDVARAVGGGAVVAADLRSDGDRDAGGVHVAIGLRASVNGAAVVQIGRALVRIRAAAHRVGGTVLAGDRDGGDVAGADRRRAVLAVDDGAERGRRGADAILAGLRDRRDGVTAFQRRGAQRRRRAVAQREGTAVVAGHSEGVDLARADGVGAVQAVDLRSECGRRTVLAGIGDGLDRRGGVVQIGLALQRRGDAADGGGVAVIADLGDRDDVAVVERRGAVGAGHDGRGCDRRAVVAGIGAGADQAAVVQVGDAGGGVDIHRVGDGGAVIAGVGDGDDVGAEVRGTGVAEAVHVGGRGQREAVVARGGEGIDVAAGEIGVAVFGADFDTVGHGRARIPGAGGGVDVGGTDSVGIAGRAVDHRTGRYRRAVVVGVGDGRDAAAVVKQCIAAGGAGDAAGGEGDAVLARIGIGRDRILADRGGAGRAVDRSSRRISRAVVAADGHRADAVAVVQLGVARVGDGEAAGRRGIAVVTAVGGGDDLSAADRIGAGLAAGDGTVSDGVAVIFGIGGGRDAAGVIDIGHALRGGGAVAQREGVAVIVGSGARRNVAVVDRRRVGQAIDLRGHRDRRCAVAVLAGRICGRADAAGAVQQAVAVGGVGDAAEGIGGAVLAAIRRGADIALADGVGVAITEHERAVGDGGAVAVLVGRGRGRNAVVAVIQVGITQRCRRQVAERGSVAVVACRRCRGDRAGIDRRCAGGAERDRSFRIGGGVISGQSGRADRAGIAHVGVAAAEHLQTVGRRVTVVASLGVGRHVAEADGAGVGCALHHRAECDRRAVEPGDRGGGNFFAAVQVGGAHGRHRLAADRQRITVVAGRRERRDRTGADGGSAVHAIHHRRNRRRGAVVAGVGRRRNRVGGVIQIGVTSRGERQITLRDRIAVDAGRGIGVDLAEVDRVRIRAAERHGRFGVGVGIVAGDRGRADRTAVVHIGKAGAEHRQAIRRRIAGAAGRSRGRDVAGADRAGVTVALHQAADSDRRAVVAGRRRRTDGIAAVEEGVALRRNRLVADRQRVAVIARVGDGGDPAGADGVRAVLTVNDRCDGGGGAVVAGIGRRGDRVRRVVQVGVTLRRDGQAADRGRVSVQAGRGIGVDLAIVDRGGVGVAEGCRRFGIGRAVVAAERGRTDGATVVHVGIAVGEDRQAVGRDIAVVPGRGIGRDVADAVRAGITGALHHRARRIGVAVAAGRGRSRHQFAAVQIGIAARRIGDAARRRGQPVVADARRRGNIGGADGVRAVGAVHAGALRRGRTEVAGAGVRADAAAVVQVAVVRAGRDDDAGRRRVAVIAGRGGNAHRAAVDHGRVDIAADIRTNGRRNAAVGVQAGRGRHVGRAAIQQVRAAVGRLDIEALRESRAVVARRGVRVDVAIAESRRVEVAIDAGGDRDRLAVVAIADRRIGADAAAVEQVGAVGVRRDRDAVREGIAVVSGLGDGAEAARTQGLRIAVAVDDGALRDCGAVVAGISTGRCGAGVVEISVAEERIDIDAGRAGEAVIPGDRRRRRIAQHGGGGAVVAVDQRTQGLGFTVIAGGSEGVDVLADQAGDAVMRIDR